eukprot:TRINITY_DN4563_c0_g1_i2.p1 TRINITY_DN4563_c0_g1~~TRINITY_DN4563_c0_g1_i2.p1  ORF type:complete len:265 (-),score=47.27 TRINITY_DN4563_c0_g1_i2:37-831(-)
MLIFLGEKENRCVRCGRSDGYCRHSIVPHCFRAYLPIYVKSHNSHDIVLLCDGCAHYTYLKSEQLKRTISEEYGIPFTSGSSKYETDTALARVKAAGKALVKGKNIPSERKEVLKNILAEHFQKAISELADDDFEVAANLDVKKQKNDYIAHSKLIVEKLNDDLDAIEKFIKRWRQHFVEEMQPKYLPPHWSVDHPIVNRNGTKFGPQGRPLNATPSSSSSTHDEHTPLPSPSFSYPQLSQIEEAVEVLSISSVSQDEVTHTLC